MNSPDRLLNFFQERLRLRGDLEPIAPEDSLFVSGRLDSLDAMQTILYLEEHFGVDFSSFDFSLERIDSLAAVLALAGLSGDPVHGVGQFEDGL